MAFTSKVNHGPVTWLVPRRWRTGHMNKVRTSDTGPICTLSSTRLGRGGQIFDRVSPAFRHTDNLRPPETGGGRFCIGEPDRSGRQSNRRCPKELNSMCAPAQGHLGSLAQALVNSNPITETLLAVPSTTADHTAMRHCT